MSRWVWNNIKIPTWISYSDNATIDPFGRLRVSNPTTLFDSKQLFDNAPLFFDDQEVSGSGTTSTHSTAKACTTMGVSANTAWKRVRQSFMRFNYQPWKWHLILCTWRMSWVGTWITAAMWYFDDNNGLFFKEQDWVLYAVRRTSTSWSPVDNEVAQSSFNIDHLDWTWPSWITLDLSKTQIAFIDFEWLWVWRVRMWFVIDGLIYYCHEFLNANNLTTVYMSTPNLPIRYEIENDGTWAAADMDHICSSVMSEWWADNNWFLASYKTAAISSLWNSASYAIMWWRLKSTHLWANIIVENLSVIGSANDQAEWAFYVWWSVAWTFTFNDQTNSAVQVAEWTASNTFTGGKRIDGWFFTTEQWIQFTVPNAARLWSAIDGTPQEWYLVITPITNNITVRASVTWRELL